MKNLLNKSLLLIVFAIGTFSCVEEEGPASSITSFDEFTVVSSSFDTFGEVDEEDATYTVKFLFDSKQIIDLTLLVQEGPSSQATAGVDFVILNDHIDVDALTSDSISVDIMILSDFAAEENETIFLEFVGENGDPRPLEVQVGTIIDNGLTVEPAATSIDFQLSWAFDDANLAMLDACDVVGDMDFIINTAFSYTGDLFPGNAASTLSCPESGTITVASLPEATPYNMYVVVFAGVDFGAAGAMSVTVDYERGASNLAGSFTVAGFDSSMNGAGGAIATIERNGDVVTIKDLADNIISEGKADATLLSDIINIKDTIK